MTWEKAKKLAILVFEGRKKGQINQQTPTIIHTCLFQLWKIVKTWRGRDSKKSAPFLVCCLDDVIKGQEVGHSCFEGHKKAKSINRHQLLCAHVLFNFEKLSKQEGRERPVKKLNEWHTYYSVFSQRNCVARQNTCYQISTEQNLPTFYYSV